MSEKLCHLRDFVSQSLEYARGGIYNKMNLHGEVFTVKVVAVVCEGRRRQLPSMIWWEIEGFLLTVGDGYRKLGGHGREMILRRDGDSPLVNDEFENELQGCKKPMSRDPMKTVVRQVILLLLMRMKKVMLQVILLRLL